MVFKTFEELVKISQPSTFLSTEWLSYSPFGFGDTFLPNVRRIEASSMYVYDGASIFYDMIKMPKSVIQLFDDDKILQFFCFTYPEIVPAAQHKNKVVPGKYDCCMFVELSDEKQVQLSYKFGQYFFRFIMKQKGSYTKTKELEDRTIKMSLDAFRTYFLIPEN